MLQVARLAPNLLSDAAPRVEQFLLGELAEDGGAKDRGGASDLYYTAFLLDALVALRASLPVERVSAYLSPFGAGEGLDLVHRACLVRCWSALGIGWPATGFAAEVCREVEHYRAADGGYAPRAQAASGTLYDAFLALGVYQDLGLPLPDGTELGRSFELLRTTDGAYANARDLAWGTTPSTAAAAALLVQLELPVPPEVAPWLLARQHPKGGFRAMPDAPLPDLLSTATALHALTTLGQPIASTDAGGARRELALDFVDSLWSGRSFYGHWADDTLDCEYAFYALLALGHLAVGDLAAGDLAAGDRAR
jgi:prenyltransferase beta subunit